MIDGVFCRQVSFVPCFIWPGKQLNIFNHGLCTRGKFDFPKEYYIFHSSIAQRILIMNRNEFLFVDVIWFRLCKSLPGRETQWHECCFTLVLCWFWGCRVFIPSVWVELDSNNSPSEKLGGYNANDLGFGVPPFKVAGDLRSIQDALFKPTVDFGRGLSNIRTLY